MKNIVPINNNKQCTVSPLLLYLLLINILTVIWWNRSSSWKGLVLLYQMFPGLGKWVKKKGQIKDHFQLVGWTRFKFSFCTL